MRGRDAARGFNPSMTRMGAQSTLAGALFVLAAARAAAWSSAARSSPLAKITVVEPSGVARRGAPITIGVPLAKGAAVSDPATLALVRADRPGAALPLCRFEPLARWELSLIHI